VKRCGASSPRVEKQHGFGLGPTGLRLLAHPGLRKPRMSDSGKAAVYVENYPKRKYESIIITSFYS